MDQKSSTLDITSSSSSSSKGRTSCQYYGSQVTLVIGLLFLTFGLVSLFGNDQFYSHILKQELGLSPYSKSYDVWHETPVPMYLEFYLFNWTNPDKLGTEKPAFTEMGPYRFTEKQVKENVTWNSNNDTVSYRRKKFWFYDEEKSSGSLDDVVTTLNAVSLSAAFTVRDWSFVMQKSLSVSLSTMGQKIVIRKKVSELLFDGYEDNLLNLARTMPKFEGIELPFDRFGWFYTRNGSLDFDGYFNMETGASEINKIGYLKNWNYNNQTSFYPDHCANIEGSAGEFWPPNQSTETPLTMYSPDLCRSISFSYDRNSTVNGIPGYTYVLDKYLLDNGTLNSDNLCYCNGECSPSGVINVTSCHYGAPAFVSYPHFHLADSQFADSVDGMSPDPERHQFYITLEPNVGIPLDVGARLQINLLLQPIKYIDLYKNVPKIYFPMFWFNERATMPPEMAESFKLFLKLPDFLFLFSIFIVLIGLVILLISILLFILQKRVKNVNQYTGNIINVQLKGTEPHVGTPLMEKMETSLNFGQTNKLALN